LRPRRRLLASQVLLHRALVEGIGRPALNRDGPARTFAQTGPQAIAIRVTDQAGLAIDDLDRPFSARRGAQASIRTISR
jgi:hypothetical protein